MNLIRAWARDLPKTALGPLRLWHYDRYPHAHRGVPFEQRTLGGLLREYYLSVVARAELLRERVADLESEELDELSKLENILRGDRRSLRNLTEAESLEVWAQPNYTGDPLTDYWEYRVTKDLLDPEEMNLQGPPERPLWGEPWEVIKPTVQMMPSVREMISRGGLVDDVGWNAKLREAGVL